MKKILCFLWIIICALPVSGSSGIDILVEKPVAFTHQSLLPGSSSALLKTYSSFAADKPSVFVFTHAAVDKLKNCHLSVTCEEGKITGIAIVVEGTADIISLKQLAGAWLGEAEETAGPGTKGVHHYILPGGKSGAQLLVQEGKSAVLTIK